MKKNLYEILDEFKAAKTEREKRQVLVDNHTPDFVAFLQCAFDPRVKFVKFPIPVAVDKKVAGPGEYKRDNVPPGMGYSNIGNAIKKVYLFVDGHPRRPTALTAEKTSELLAGLLEGLEAREAEVFVQMVTKNVKVPGLTKALVEKTYPGIFEIGVNV